MKTTLCILTVALFAATPFGANAAAKLSKAERRLDFQQIFNGTDLSGWRHGGNWHVSDDGSISRKGKGGSLVYSAAKVPDDFELRFEWKVGVGSNSGVYYRPTQYEYQILDNEKHVDGGNPRTSAASLYFCMAPSADVTKKPGEWNQGRIVCQGTLIQHWLNGKKVIDFDYTDEQFTWNVELLRKRGGDLTARGANLSLQDHGDPVWYQNLRWREIPAGEKVAHQTVQPVEIGTEVLEKEAKKLKGIMDRRSGVKK